MNATVALHANKTLELTEALLIYSNGGEDRFVTHHRVKDGVLGPANNIPKSFVDSLAKGLGNQLEVELLTPYMLVRTQSTTVWWTPQQRRTIHFHCKETDRLGIREFDFIHPALVWMVHRGSLYLRALPGSVRPEADTLLAVAPYWNIDDSGLVCLGSMRTPENRSLALLKKWEDGFFESSFTHPNRTQIVNSYLPYFSFLLAQMQSGQEFSGLITADQTLGQFIKGGR